VQIVNAIAILVLVLDDLLQTHNSASVFGMFFFSFLEPLGFSFCKICHQDFTWWSNSTPIFIVSLGKRCRAAGKQLMFQMHTDRPIFKEKGG
jgi:hypothetical protein